MKRPAPWRLLAIDSGHPECAYAAACDGLIVDAGPGAVGWAGFNRVVVEIPTLRGGNTPNPEDLLLIAVAGARAAERALRPGGTLVEYRPAEWKGNTPKPPHHARMWQALTPEEQTLLGGRCTAGAIAAACARGAKDRWRKPGARYYRASEYATVVGVRITHDILDAVALALYDLGRIKKG